MCDDEKDAEQGGEAKLVTALVVEMCCARREEFLKVRM